jgi:hypothetical protein
MPTTESKVRKGLLQLEADTAGQWEEFSCQPTNVSITPDTTAGTGDELEVLCGDVLASADADKRSATLNIEAVQDFTNAAGFQAYSWVHDGEKRRFRWNPTSDAADQWEGYVSVKASEIGGEVGTRITTSVQWTINSLRLPTKFGADVWWLGSAGDVYVNAGMKGQAAPGYIFPADPAGTSVAALTTAGYVAVPQTTWTPGQKITVGTIVAHWDGSDWQAGPA